MRKKIGIGIIAAIIMIVAALYIDYNDYRRNMDAVVIVHYITGSGSGYSTVYLTAIVPITDYSEGKTVETIRRYVICRNKGVPNTLQIVLYDSMEEFRRGVSYIEVTFHDWHQ